MEAKFEQIIRNVISMAQMGRHGDDIMKTSLEEVSVALRQPAVIRLLPDSDEIRMKARELDEKDFDRWWWETVYKGNIV